MKHKYIFLLLVLCGFFNFSFSQVLPDSTQLKAYENFNTRNGKWILRWDQQTGTPAVMYGSKSKSYSSLENKEQIARQFLKDQSAVFKMKNDLSDLSKFREKETNEGAVIDFQQYYKNIPIYYAEYSVAVGPDKTVYMTAGKYFKNISCDTKPVITSDQAIDIGIKAMDLKNESEIYSKTNLVIFPIEEKFILAYQVYLDKWELIVDAVNGDVVKKFNKYCDVNGTGRVYPNDPVSSSLTTVTLPRLDGSGYLVGTHVTVWHSYSFTPAYDPNNNFFYTPSPWNQLTNTSNFDDVNVYYHGDKFAREYWYSKLGAIGNNYHANASVEYRNTDGAGVRLPPSVQEPVMCFGTGGVMTKNSAQKSDVIYHEYTHIMNWLIGLNGGFEAAALSEGYSDYHAASFTNDPHFGEHWVNNSNTGDSRTVATSASGVWSEDSAGQHNGWNYNNRATLKYGKDPDLIPIYGDPWLNPPGDEHTVGMIWGGALWDLRNRLGANTADYLIYQGLVHRHVSDMKFQDARDGLLIADYHIYNSMFHNIINSIMNARGIPTSGLYKIGTEQNQIIVPSKFEIAQNYPNPFNPSTTISYTLPEEGKVTIRVYDIMGREVKTLADEVQTSGIHSVVWQGMNMYGIEVASGMYFYNVRFGGNSITKKMVLMK
jgi:Zn-dependent metalloprotease